jgi:hypothetical protein
MAACTAGNVQDYSVNEAGHVDLLLKCFTVPALIGLKEGGASRVGPPHLNAWSIVCWKRKLLRSCSNDVHDAAPAAGAEFNGACLKGEQRVIPAAANIGTGVEVGAALADDDLAGLDDLAAEALDAEVLSV